VAPVGAYPADVSLYGVYDLAGNVREWVADWYQWDYYASAPAHNPAGPTTGVTRVLRGGSWNDVAVYLRTTVRKNYLPDSYDSNLGFRCASSALPLR
jgi:formylglycine-generating enzyme required for sulfatase activity